MIDKQKKERKTAHTHKMPQHHNSSNDSWYYHFQLFGPSIVHVSLSLSHTHTHTGTHARTHTLTARERERERERDRQTDRQTDRQRQRQRDRQTDRDRETHIINRLFTSSFVSWFICWIYVQNNYIIDFVVNSFSWLTFCTCVLTFWTLNHNIREWWLHLVYTNK